MKKKVLLLDTNFSAKPIYDALQNKEFDVYVVGGNPTDTLAKSSKNYINLDYSKFNQVLNLIDSEQFDYLVPGGNDFSYTVCAQIADKRTFFNIDPPDIFDKLNNKLKFRKLAVDLSLNVPTTIETNEVEANIPVIVKPADAYSGHGITIISKYTAAQIENAITKAKHYSKTASFLIEEFVSGQLFSHSAFLENGEIVVDFIVEEHSTANPFVVDTSRLVYDFNKKVLQHLRNDIHKLADNLKLHNGLIHTQFISNGNKLWIIEITRRCPGDLYSLLIEYSTGYKYAENYANSFINQPISKNNIYTTKNVIRHTISSPHSLDFSNILFRPLNEKQILFPLVTTGDKLGESPWGRVALMFLFNKNANSHKTCWQTALDKKLYRLF